MAIVGAGPAGLFAAFYAGMRNLKTLVLEATGITDGSLVRGVRYGPGGVTTESIVMRARSGTVRTIRATHQLERLMKFSQVDYGA